MTPKAQVTKEKLGTMDLIRLKMDGLPLSHQGVSVCKVVCHSFDLHFPND